MNGRKPRGAAGQGGPFFVAGRRIGPDHVIGHRGAAALAPENTLPSLAAARRAGCRWVECDVRLTRDGVAVVFHDSRLDRTSDGGGRVRNTMWRDLALLDAGGWFSPRFAGTRIPRLEDWLDAAADFGLGLNLEIKPDRGDGPETAAALAAAVAARWPGRLPPPIVSSFDSAALRWLREQRSGLPLALLRRLWPANPQREIAAVGADALHIPDRIARADRLAAARQAGLTLRVYTINNRHRAETLLDAGVAAVFSDAPDRLLRR